MFDTQMEPAVARDMIKGAADPLMSAFSLRYSQLLQLSRTEGSSPEMMLRVRLVLQHAGCHGPTNSLVLGLNLAHTSTALSAEFSFRQNFPDTSKCTHH
jgi:hypothetical protein